MFWFVVNSSCTQLVKNIDFTPSNWFRQAARKKREAKLRELGIDADGLKLDSGDNLGDDNGDGGLGAVEEPELKMASVKDLMGSDHEDGH